jgi:hypothetical protein
LDSDSAADAVLPQLQGRRVSHDFPPAPGAVYDRAKGSERSKDDARRKSDLPFLNEQQKRKILGGNAQRLFNLKPVLSDWKLKRRAELSAGAQPCEAAAAGGVPA